MPKPINPGRTIRGSRGDDTIQGTYGDDNLYGLGENDQIFASDGADVVYGGSGDDTMFGQEGNDFLFGEDGNDLLVGGWGNDVLDGGGGYDVLYGSSGNDTFVWGSEVHADGGYDIIQGGYAVYLYANEGEGVTLSRQADGHYVATSSRGTAYFDMPIGYGPAELYMTGGDDFIEVMPGVQTFAGAGNDRFFSLTSSSLGLPGALHGGDGSDFFEIRLDSGAAVRAEGSAATVTSFDAAGWPHHYATTFSVENWIGSEQRDTFDLTQAASGAVVIAWGGNDRIDGSEFEDRLDGGLGDDIVLGWGGDDVIAGSLGNDTLGGGAGSDSISGYFGDDVLEGGLGADRLSGGAGADIFRYYYAADSVASAPDSIGDFNPGEGDVIDVSGIGTFEYVGSSYQSGAGAQATLSYNGTSTVLNLYLEGDDVADATVIIFGQHSSIAGISGVVDFY